jgi:catechol 2,3-dioxygenase-like lactoylglutathione lyase family enzyme
MQRAFGLIAAVAACAAAPAAAQQDQFAPGLRSVKIEATDFDKSTAFYTAIGMKPGAVRGDTRDMVWEGTSSNSGIVMTSTAYATRAKMVRGGTYLMVMAPDVDAVLARLRQAGFTDLPETRQIGTMVTVAFLKDPDGNTIELMGPPAAK